ncbi:ubiquitin thioesterase zranb1-like [Oppia nitens]|uniref:ubiquitin thioesterase zranb1-like n=1 Tax=Oppia nitens TaxID=1686743 RepID=UPI0023DCA15F|nr:ubiquitin thioesterase zranb1-like [Oppia nitens]
MSDMSSGKWQCCRCTYHNYMKANKCTMCLDTRQSIQLIIDDNDHQNTSQHIYKKSSLSETMSDKNETNKKWWCDVCTFLNHYKSLKCSQCLTVRRVRSPKGEADGHQMTFNESNGSGVGSHVDGQHIVCDSIGNNKVFDNSYSNDKNKYVSIGVESGFKWSCSACTYDNWMAAKKCVLCYTIKKDISIINERQATASTNTITDGQNEKRNESPLSQISESAAKECSNNEYNNIKTLSDISSSANECVDYIEDNQKLYELDLLIGQSSRPVAKRVPSDVSPFLAAEIRRLFANGLKQRKGEFACFFVTDFFTFALPPEIEDLSSQIQERLFDEYLDRDVQKELEEESPIINWSLELTERLGSRLYALWNRSTGDCLLDSVLQATYGIFDRDNTMRKALGDSLIESSSQLFPRFKEAETLQANLLHYTLDDDQWREDWAIILSLATQPGQSLEQIHIFTLAHILRRPIIVYAIKIVKSFKGDSLGYAGYEGIYLPLLWEPSFCWKSPIALGYTRGHFSALVAIEPEPSDEQIGAGANFRSNDDNEVIYLPLITSEHQLLPLHFLSHNELGREEDIMRQWLDCCVTTGGILAAKQKIPRKPLLVAQMMDEWLDFYRNLPQPSLSECIKTNDFSSDDSDQEI